MDVDITAAIIAASVAVVTSIANICITIHRNKQDGITANRMNWINEVRNEFACVLSWVWYTDGKDGITINPIDDLRKSVYKISLYLNVKDDYDHEVLEKTFQYLKHVDDTYKGFVISQSTGSTNNQIIAMFMASSSYEEAEKIKQELQKLVRVYLKTEWTRVKAESSICKFKYRYCWSLFKGFQSAKAIEKFKNEYKD